MKTFKNFLIGFGTFVIGIFSIIGSSWVAGYCLKLLTSEPFNFASDFESMTGVGFVCLIILACIVAVMYLLYGFFADLGCIFKKKLYKK